jgi:hypothetical protein
MLIGRLHPHAITAEKPDKGDETELAERLAAIVSGAPSLMRVLLTIRALDLPDWLIMSGAVYQRVLNALTKRPPDYGVRDYDLGYFDASDISYEAEDAVIRRVAATFDDRLHIAAPFGLADLFALRLRPNPRRFSANFSQIAAGVTRRWPEVTVESAILERCTAATQDRIIT